MEVLENLKQSIALLKDIDNYHEQLLGDNGLISACDKKIDYWLHYIELNDLKVTEAYKILKEMKRLRILRRQYKNDAELIKMYKDHEAKMQNSANRDILLVQVCKVDTKHKNAKFSYDAYTEEEFKEILYEKKKGLLDKILKKGNEEE